MTRVKEMMALVNLERVEDTSTSVMGDGLQRKGGGVEVTARVEPAVG